MTSDKQNPVMAWGELGTVYRDGSFQDPTGQWFSHKDMKAIAHECRNWNRIQKPKQLLFYIDCMNGRTRNWKEHTKQ